MSWASEFGIWWVDLEYWPRQAVSLSLEPDIAEASREYCPIAQLAERLTLDQEVPGSNPGRAAGDCESKTVVFRLFLCRIRSNGVLWLSACLGTSMYISDRSGAVPA